MTDATEILDVATIDTPKTVRQIIFGRYPGFLGYALPIWVAATVWRFALINSFPNRLLHSIPTEWWGVKHFYRNDLFVLTIDMVSYPLFLAISIPILIKYVGNRWLFLLTLTVLDVFHHLIVSDVSLDIIVYNSCLIAVFIILLYSLVKKWITFVLLAMVVAYMLADFIVFFIPGIFEVSLSENVVIWEVAYSLIWTWEFPKYELIKAFDGLITGVAFVATTQIFKSKSALSTSPAPME